MKFAIDHKALVLYVTLTLGIVIILAPSFSIACNVPVFRYALERWHPDTYRAVLFHRGPLSTSIQKLLAGLQDGSRISRVNLEIRAVDLGAAPKRDDRELFLTLVQPELPQLVVQYPTQIRLEHPIWSGRFAESKLLALTDSPVRRELLQRLTAGQAAVWLMVECGDSVQDDAAAATLELESKNIEQTLKLPELVESTEDMNLDGPSPQVEFSILRVRRDDPAEQSLVAILLGCEPDLATLGEPIVFPVFGRGRVLLPMAGAGISPENIYSSAEFLVGACSCQVKQLNPGFDLLIAADWNELLCVPKLPALASESSPRSPTGEPELVPIPAKLKIGPTVPRDVVARATFLRSDSTQSRDSSSVLAILTGIVIIGLFAAILRWQTWK